MSMGISCIIIEDQPPAQRVLKKYIDDYGSLDLVGTFSDSIQAMSFLKTSRVDLIFLDIHLPKISGIDFLKTIANPPNIILTTAFPDYALESYDLNVVDYLLKPFSFQRFIQAVNKVNQKNIKTNGSSGAQDSTKEIFIKSGHEYIKVHIDDIIFIKSDADYTELILSDRKHLTLESLRYWEENLSPDQFLRIHKSYIINTDKIEKISGGQVFLASDFKIPVGRSYKEKLSSRLKYKS